MENYLNSLHELKQCYEKYSYEDVMKMNPRALKYLCSDEKVRVITQLFGDYLVTSNVIQERIRILHERGDQTVQKRREFLDQKFR